MNSSLNTAAWGGGNPLASYGPTSEPGIEYTQYLTTDMVVNEPIDGSKNPITSNAVYDGLSNITPSLADNVVLYEVINE